MNAIPVYVISGFLGSGKTTLLTRALDAYQRRGLRPVVIMNEVGDVNLDGVAIGEGAGDVPMAELLGGCICCTIRGDLGVQLGELVASYEPDAVFIESTGVANPIEIMDAVTEASLYMPVSLESVVSVADGAFVADAAAAADKPAGRTVRLMRDQVRCADRVLLNKTDRLSPEAADRAEALLRSWNAHAPIYRTERCDVPLDALFGDVGSRSGTGGEPEPRRTVAPDAGHEPHREADASGRHEPGHGAGASPHHSHEHVSVYTRFFERPIDSHAFEAFMKTLPESVYRAKGIVTFTDTASRFLFQYAYRELDFTRIRPQGEVNDVAVFIGEQFPKERLEDGLRMLEAGRTEAERG